MENMFDCLCAALMWKGNRKAFLEGEGLQLMNLMLRERKQSRQSALKVRRRRRRERDMGIREECID